MWENKCAVRKQSLIDKSTLGLEAAHIQTYSHDGPLLPTNGILLSSDLHKAFDKGAFTFNDDLRVDIHEKVPETSELWKYSDVKLEVKKEFEVFLPYESYLHFHRENIFKTFEP